MDLIDWRAQEAADREESVAASSSAAAALKAELEALQVCESALRLGCLYDG